MAIQLLPKEVIETIAAGEVITSPTAMIKEVLENSLDSGSDFIRITVADRLLDEIEIEDNGSGIQEEDLSLLCTRHATSKLSKHSDLERISTLGFRGEALASISVLSELTVRTSTGGDEYGFEAEYLHEEMINKKRTTVKKGTKITIRKLFKNDLQKYQTFLNSKTEIKKIVALIMRYAVCYTNVSFEICTETEIKRYNIPKPPNKQSAIGNIFSQKLTHELVRLVIKVPSSDTNCTCYVTHTNISFPSPVFIMFVNRRLVEIQRIKKSIGGVYKEILVKGHPFVYLEINTAQEKVDVNVHPSKTEVYLKEEEQLKEEIEEKMREVLQTQKMSGSTKINKLANVISGENKKQISQASQTSQLNILQSVAQLSQSAGAEPKISQIFPKSAQRSQNVSQLSQSMSQSASDSDILKTPPAKRVRTDSKINPLSLFFNSPKKQPFYSPAKPSSVQKIASKIDQKTSAPSTNALEESKIETKVPENGKSESDPKEPQSKLLKDSIFIGMLSGHWAAIQNEIDMYAMNLFSALFACITRSSEEKTVYTSIDVSLDSTSYFLKESVKKELQEAGIKIENNRITQFKIPSFECTQRDSTIDAQKLSEMIASIDNPADNDRSTPHDLNSKHRGDVLFYRVLTEYYIKHHTLHIFKEIQQLFLQLPTDSLNLPVNNPSSGTRKEPSLLKSLEIVKLTSVTELYQLFSR
ncbi:DNA mismatch repair protein MLH1 [Nematocida minor]|uniref:DNA mismatch repair protein MLH1 n=1 Tax=Nematocida minor TaxID=1912983 RepID=UPI0022210560|nr:DNA mismatch repair protein MLH1 [Nematocida minor]KAI5192213.1 DNA mismatch repair protein MLH1 [Nematocida minor]